MGEIDNYTNVRVKLEGVFMGDPTTHLEGRLSEPDMLGNKDCNVYVESSFGQDILKYRGGKLITSNQEEWNYALGKKLHLSEMRIITLNM